MARTRQVKYYTVEKERNRRTGRVEYTAWAKDREGRTVNFIRGDNLRSVVRATRRAWPTARKTHRFLQHREY